MTSEAALCISLDSSHPVVGGRLNVHEENCIFLLEKAGKAGKSGEKRQKGVIVKEVIHAVLEP